MDVHEMVAEHLRRYGYDGLFNVDGECACLAENLMPCDAPCESCQPGFRGPCPDSDYDLDFGIYATLEAVEAAKKAKGDA